MILGEPLTRVLLDEPGRTPEPALDNPIPMSPLQTKTLLRLLESNEAQLREMKEEEEKVVSQALHSVYSGLFKLVDEAEKAEAEDDKASPG